MRRFFRKLYITTYKLFFGRARDRRKVRRLRIKAKRFKAAGMVLEGVLEKVVKKAAVENTKLALKLEQTEAKVADLIKRATQVQVDRTADPDICAHIITTQLDLGATNLADLTDQDKEIIAKQLGKELETEILKSNFFLEPEADDAVQKRKATQVPSQISSRNSPAMGRGAKRQGAESLESQAAEEKANKANQEEVVKMYKLPLHLNEEFRSNSRFPMSEEKISARRPEPL